MKNLAQTDTPLVPGNGHGQDGTRPRCGGPAFEQCPEGCSASGPVGDAALLPAAKAADRLGFEPFEYTERS